MREGRIDLGREDRADAQEGVGGEAIASVGLAPGMEQQAQPSLFGHTLQLATPGRSMGPV